MSILDISKCVGNGCNKKESCLRYTQPPKDKNQSWMHMGISIKVVDDCKYFWEAK